jgi:BioD-like phosphotransacetylase family protein
MKLIGAMPIPVLLTQQDSYEVAAKVHDLTVKTRPTDAEKISLIRDLIARNVDIPAILKAI